MSRLKESADKMARYLAEVFYEIDLNNTGILADLEWIKNKLIKLEGKIDAITNPIPQPEPAPEPSPEPNPIPQPEPIIPAPTPTPGPQPTPGQHDGTLVWAVGPAGSSTFLSRKLVLDEVVRSNAACISIHNMNTWHIWSNPSLGQFDRRHNERVVKDFRPIIEQTGKKFAPLLTMSKVTADFPMLSKPSDFNSVVERVMIQAAFAAELSGIMVMDLEPYRYPDGGWIEYWNPSVQGLGRETAAYELGLRLGAALNTVPGLTVYWNHGFYQNYGAPFAGTYHLGARQIHPNSYHYLAYVTAGMINGAPAVDFVNSMQLYALWHKAEMDSAIAKDKEQMAAANFVPSGQKPDTRYKNFKRSVMAYNRAWTPAVQNLDRRMTHGVFLNVIEQIKLAKDEGTFAVAYAETNGSGEAEGLAYNFWKAMP